MRHRHVPPYPAERGWQGDRLPVLCCGSEPTPSVLAEQIEARLASGAPFGVLVLERSAPDQALREVSRTVGNDRLARACVGWAVVVPRAAVRPALLARDAGQEGATDAPFPVHPCADRVEAMAWLRRRLAS